MLNVSNNANSKKFGNTCLRRRKLVLNYARYSGTHPSHEMRRHCSSNRFRCANDVRLVDIQQNNCMVTYSPIGSMAAPYLRPLLWSHLFVHSAHAVPRPNVQWTARRGRLMSARSETFQHYWNQTRRLVLVQRHQRIRYRVPLLTRTHLPGGVLQEERLERNSGKRYRLLNSKYFLTMLYLGPLRR
jgi:hypothetical protein